MDMGLWILDYRSVIIDMKLGIYDVGFGIMDMRTWMWDYWYENRDMGLGILDFVACNMIGNASYPIRCKL